MSAGNCASPTTLYSGKSLIIAGLRVSQHYNHSSHAQHGSNWSKRDGISSWNACGKLIRRSCPISSSHSCFSWSEIDSSSLTPRCIVWIIFRFDSLSHFSLRHISLCLLHALNLLLRVLHWCVNTNHYYNWVNKKDLLVFLIKLPKKNEFKIFFIFGNFWLFLPPV